MKFKKPELLRLCLSFLALIFVVVALAMFATPFVSGKYLGSTGTGFDLAFNFDSEKNFPLFLAFLFIVLAIVFVVLEIAVLCLRAAKVIKAGKKGDKLLILVFAFVEFAILVVAGIFILLTPQFFEIGKLYSLGTGAVVSAIMSFLGAFSLCLVRLVNYKNA